MQDKKQSLNIAVVGAGITGLAAAYQLMTLAKTEGLNLQVIVFESSDRAGGVIQSEKRDDRIVEFGPDSMLSTKPAGVELIKELGLEKDLIPTNTANRRSMVACGGKLQTLPEGFVMLAPTRVIPFLLSPLFSIAGKIRMALDLVSPSNLPKDDETVESFVTRRFGREALEKVVQPMVGGIYVGDVSKLSARATLPQFVEMERKFGSVIRGLLARGAVERSQERTASGARYSMFVSLKNGVQSLTDQLERIIGSENIERATEVLNLKKTSSNRWILECATAVRKQEFDAVIFATPAIKTAKILEQVEPLVSQKLSAIEIASAAVVNLLYKREDFDHPLDAFGFVVPSSEKRSILAASLISNKFPDRAPSDSVAIRVFLGGVLQPELLKRSDENLIDTAHADLTHYLGLKSKPLSGFVKRYPDSMPQYNLGHQARVEEIMSITQDRLPGVFLAGNSYHGVGIPDCIASALRTARATIEYASAPLNVESVTS
ncbi:MAG: protoporphyrinogen oxidase [Candidatus Melainabacteria bacterium]|nr:protoporphyrinogen oxidase [Candidatus Melainabacteria bacterium]